MDPRRFNRQGLEAVGQSAGRAAEIQSRGPLAGEGQGARRHGRNALGKPARVAGSGIELVILADVRLGNIRQTDAEVGKFREFLRRKQPRRQADFGQCPPEPVAGAGVIGPRLRGPAPGAGSAKDNVQTRLQNVGQDGRA